MKKSPNSFLEDLYNKRIYRLTIRNSNVNSENYFSQSNLSPLWITGMFRSGTSITTKVISQLGFDLGPDEDLLQPIGYRKKLNPDGFFENYLLMDFSLQVFYMLNAWGDDPPNKEDVESFNTNQIKYKEFIYNSIVNIHDDRISNKNKSRILKNYFPGNLDDYFKNSFKEKFAVKNPHFCLLYPLIDKLFPNGKYLVVFRNPEKVVSSAIHVTPNANLDLYYSYYNNISKHPNAMFFDYDVLANNPKESILALAKALGCDIKDESIHKIINQKNISDSINIELPEKIKQLYGELKNKAINKK